MIEQRVLVVDDNEAYLSEIRALLGEAGYRVSICSDSLKAIPTIKNDQISCVILDYRMPHLDGQDLLQLIHSSHPEIPIIICSGFLDARSDLSLIRLGAREVLHKPFDHNKLFDTVRKAVEAQEDVMPVFITGYNIKNAKLLVLRKLIVKALSDSGFNVTHSAKLLGISRQCLIRYMKSLNISRES